MVKQTKLLVAEVRMIADTVENQYCRDILLEAADRLEETDKIAEHYRRLAEKRIKRRRNKKAVETCICCGATIPEGRQICPQCEKEGETK